MTPSLSLGRRLLRLLLRLLRSDAGVLGLGVLVPWPRSRLVRRGRIVRGRVRRGEALVWGFRIGGRERVVGSPLHIVLAILVVLLLYLASP